MTSFFFLCSIIAEIRIKVSVTPSTAEQTTTIWLPSENEETVFATFVMSLGDASDVPPNFNTSFKVVYLPSQSINSLTFNTWCQIEVDSPNIGNFKFNS